MDNNKKAAAAAAVAAVITASGAAVDANFDNPADLLQQTAVEPKVQHITLPSEQADDSALQDDEKAKKAEQKGGAFREWILSLPLAVRVVFILPQWFIGNLIITGGSMLFTALSPVWNWILSFVLMTLIIGAAFAVSVKAIFPDIPWGKIVNRHTMKGILLASVLAFALHVILSIFWPAYARFKTVLVGVITLAAIGAMVLWYVRRENKRRIDAAQEEEYFVEESDELVYSSLGETFTIRRPKE